MTIQEKIEKEKKKLQALKEQKAVLDEKIKKSEAEIERCEMIVNQQKYSLAASVFENKGITLDEILQAVQAGDMLSLQEKMERITEEKADEAADMADSTSEE